MSLRVVWWCAMAACLGVSACGDDGAGVAQGGGQGAAVQNNGDAPDAGGVDDEADAAEVDAVAWCEGQTSQIYDPAAAEDLDMWPDAHHLVEDASSPTGVRVSVSKLGFVEATINPLLHPIITPTDLVSGFAANGSVYFRFDGALSLESLSQDAEASLEDNSVIVLALDEEPVRRVAYEVSALEEGTTLVIRTVKPFEHGARYAVIVTDEATDEAGGCLAPSEATRAVLTGSREGSEVVTEQWLEALSVVDLELSQVSAMTTFQVHNEPVIYEAIAEDINDSEYEWLDAQPCVEEEQWRRCEVFYEPRDYRDDKAVLTPQAQGRHRVPVTIWLPLESETPPLPILFGHGANTGRRLGEQVAPILIPEGYALIATEALEHDGHPVRTGGPLPDFVNFLGIGAAAPNVGVDAERLRGSFNQSMLEWAQLAQLIKREGDIDGDGQVEFDSSRVAYLGVSLGGLLGAGLSAISDDLEASYLLMGGGWLISFVVDIQEVQGVLALLHPLVGGEARFERLLIAAQTGVDPADPATWGQRILQDRVLGDPAPHLCFPVTIHDEIVPFRAGRALATAIDMPQMAPSYRPVPLLDVQEGPFQGNLGGTTAGYVQFDQVTSNGNRRAATHNGLPLSDESVAQMTRFFNTWRDTGTPEIIATHAQ